MNDITVNILEHELVPKHEVLTKKERSEVLEKFNVTAKNMPKILASDPVIERIEAKHGDIVRITRKSSTAGESIYYRVVFDPTRKKVKVEPVAEIVPADSAEITEEEQKKLEAEADIDIGDESEEESDKEE